MPSSKVTIQYPNEIQFSMQLTESEMGRHLLLMAALKMFELGNITSGTAAELADMSRVEFFEACGRYHVSIPNYPEDEIEREIAADMEIVNKVQRQ